MAAHSSVLAWRIPGMAEPGGLPSVGSHRVRHDWSALAAAAAADCGLPGFSVREEGSPGKNTGVYWPVLVATPFYSTIFPAALATNP